jgi:hypothetical protein
VRDEFEPCRPVIAIALLDPGPGVGIKARCLQDLVHKLIILLEVLPLQGHSVTQFFVILKEEDIIFILEVRAYDIIKGNICSSHSRIELVNERNLPDVPAVVCLACHLGTHCNSVVCCTISNLLR